MSFVESLSYAILKALPPKNFGAIIIEMKKHWKVPKVSLALPVVQCKMFFDSKNELFYDDPDDTDDFIVEWFLTEKDKHVARHLAAAAVPTCQQKGIIIT